MSRLRIENLNPVTTLSGTEATAVVAGAVYVGFGSSGYSPVSGDFCVMPYGYDFDRDYTPNDRYGYERFDRSWGRGKPSHHHGHGHQEHHNFRGFGRH